MVNGPWPRLTTAQLVPAPSSTTRVASIIPFIAPAPPSTLYRNVLSRSGSWRRGLSGTRSWIVLMRGPRPLGPSPSGRPRRFAPRDPVVVHDREEPRPVVAEPEPPALAAHAGRGPRRRRRSAASSSIAISMTETNWYTTKWTR